MFSAKVQDCFEMPGKGLVVMLSEPQGTPKIGGVVELLGGHFTIADIGQPVAARGTGTGTGTGSGTGALAQVTPEGALVLAWRPGTPAPQGIRGAPIKEVVLL